jgi:hypothetical protein
MIQFNRSTVSYETTTFRKICNRMPQKFSERSFIHGYDRSLMVAVLYRVRLRSRIVGGFRFKRLFMLP